MDFLNDTFQERPEDDAYCDEFGHGMKVRAASNIYTKSGLEKVICISHFDDFLIHHLPNKYSDKYPYGTWDEILRDDIKRIMDIND